MNSPRIHDVYDRPTATYRLYDRNGALLYVGVTCNLKSRWADHRRRKPWWPQVATKSVDWHPTRFKALSAEKAAIESERPMYNIGQTPAFAARIKEQRGCPHVCEECRSSQEPLLA
ncbi:GIY-YIG nuclease family protein [Micromonospora carbonacea]|uniref:GIY-YIG nuclease family protein n=1 Tax=Micromonospora carbonacea TaxID=47853 RepID=UPI000942F077